MSNFIRPGLDFEIYYLFHKEPVQGFVLKILHPGLFCGTQWRHRNDYSMKTMLYEPLPILYCIRSRLLSFTE